MKQKLKKIVSTVALFVLMLTGCSGGTQTTPTTAPAADTPTIKETTDTTATEKQVIRVGTSGQYEPYCMMENGELVGFEIDVWNEIAKRANLELEWTTASFNGLMGMLDSGKIDTFAQQISVTEEREKKYTFSEIYAYNPLGIVVRKDDNSIKELKDLEGKKVATSATAVTKTIIDEYNKTAATPVELVIYGDGGDKMKDVEMGRVDALFLSEVATLSSIEKANYELKFVKYFVYDEINAYPFLKTPEADALREKVNQAIKAMHADGTLTEISTKWCNMDVTKNPKAEGTAA